MNNKQSIEIKYPVTAHHRVIVHAAMRDDEATHRAFTGFNLLEPPKIANMSAGGKYLSYSLSVTLVDAEEARRFDECFKLIPGLKLVL